MPQPPNVDGLPGWLQITITLLFGVVTLIVGIRQYQRRPREESVVHSPMAHLADMGAIRHFSDTVHNLTSEIVSLERCMAELTHHLRQQNDLDREVCQRLRELKERLDRPPAL